MTLQDLSIYEESLFINMKSKGLTDTQAALQIALDKITAKISQSGSEITRQQLNEYKRLIKEEISKSYDGLYAAMQDESVKAAEVVGSYMAITTQKIPTKVIDDLINSKRNILGYEFQELFKIQSENHERALRVVLGSGVAQGLPANEIVKTLMDKSESLSQGQLVTATNTVIKQSREEARYARYREYEAQGIVKGYMYDSVLDGRTSEICRANSNRKFMVKLDEVPLDARPPLHPNCRSVLTVISTNEYTDDTKASMFGETKNESYPEWLKNLPEDKQKIVLGKKYQAYKDNKYKVKSLADVKGVATHSMDDIGKAMNDAVKAPKVPEIKDYSHNPYNSSSSKIASKNLSDFIEKDYDLSMEPDLIDGMAIGIGDVMSKFKHSGKLTRVEKTMKSQIASFSYSIDGKEEGGYFKIGRFGNSYKDLETNKTFAKSLFDNDIKSYENTARLVQEKIKQGKKIPPIMAQAVEKLEKAKRLKQNTTRFSVADDAKSRFEYARTVFNHETWHKIDYDNSLNKKFKDLIIGIDAEEIVKVSAYSLKGGSMELFAEVGALYSSGKKSQIPESILKAFEETIKGVKNAD